MEEKKSSQEEAKKVGLKLISKTLLYAFAIFGLIFILILCVVMLFLGTNIKFADVPESAILEIDFNEKYTEVRQDDFYVEFMGQSGYSLFDLERAIFFASDDPRVKALSARVDQTSLGLAQIQEICEAVHRFRNNGKKAYIFSSGMGSLGKGSKEYALATCFDQIGMQPHSEIGITGVSIEIPFLKNLLDKIGVEAEFYKRHEYKNAMASFTESEIRPQFQEELEYLGSRIFRMLQLMVALNRDLDASVVTKAFDTAPIFVDQALDMKLIDWVGYRSDFNDFLKHEYNAELYDIKDYIASFSDEISDGNPQFALLVLEGVISQGTSSNTPLSDTIIGSDTVLKQIEEIKKLKNLKAVVVRINSPGGSYTASDEILYALLKLKSEKNVPIVVSMGEYAASGGYFIALAGDTIVADEATLTGSIGVLGGKFVLSGLWEKLGVNWADFNYGQNAGILSMNHKFTVAERAVVNRSLTMIYDDFTEKVSQYRHIPMNKMGKIARGRVWLGSDAVVEGLVDKLGGVVVALFDAKEMVGLTPYDPISLVYYPRRPSFQEKIVSYIENGGGLPAVKAFENLGISFEDMRLMQRLKFDAVLPPYKVEM